MQRLAAQALGDLLALEEMIRAPAHPPAQLMVGGTWPVAPSVVVAGAAIEQPMQLTGLDAQCMKA